MIASTRWPIARLSIAMQLTITALALVIGPAVAGSSGGARGTSSNQSAAYIIRGVGAGDNWPDEAMADAIYTACIPEIVEYSRYYGYGGVIPLQGGVLSDIAQMLNRAMDETPVGENYFDNTVKRCMARARIAYSPRPTAAPSRMASTPPTPVAPQPTLYTPSQQDSEQIALLDRALTEPVARPAPAPKPRPKEPFPPPVLHLERNDGTECLKVEMTNMRLSDNREYWNFDMAFKNICNFDVVWKLDYATGPKDDPSGLFFGGPPVVFGGIWVNWNARDLPNVGFPIADARGEGMRITANWVWSGSSFVPADQPTPDFHVWMISCEAFAPGRIAKTMFTTGDRLRENKPFACVPNIYFDK